MEHLILNHFPLFTKLVLQTETHNSMAWVTSCKGLSLAIPKLRSFKSLDFPPESSCFVTEDAMGSGAQVPATPGGRQ